MYSLQRQYPVARTVTTQVDPLATIAKVGIGQTLDQFSPAAGAAFHSAALITAKNPLDVILSGLGLFGSLCKIERQGRIF